MKRDSHSPASPNASPSSPPNPCLRYAPCSGRRKPGARSCRRSGPRIFLSLSDDASTQLASNLCGEVERVKPSYGLSETSRSAGVSLLSGAVGSGKKDMAWSKNFALQWQVLFQPRDFSRLENCQAICVPYDGAQTLEATRVYLKPYYLPRELGYWQAKDQGKI